MEKKRSVQSIPDDELLHRLTDLMGQSRRVEVDIVAHIGEVDERRLYARWLRRSRPGRTFWR